MFRIASYTTTGVRKTSNQDGYCALVANTDFGEIALAVMCDGVGGLSKGELASSIVVRRFSEWFELGLPRYVQANLESGRINLSNLRFAWSDLIESLNDEIRELGDLDDTRMGTTFSGILFCQGRYFLGHVGDCRIYQVGTASLRVLTHDQTVVARELANGTISEEEALHHPQRNVLLQSIGTQRAVAPEFDEGIVDRDSLFVLCCDGFYRDLGDRVIKERFSSLVYASESEMASVCAEMSQEAIGAGSVDNVSVLCLCNAELVAPRRWEAEDGTVDLAAYEATTVLGASEDGSTGFAGGLDHGEPDESPTTVLAGDSAADASYDAFSTSVLVDDSPTSVIGDIATSSSTGGGVSMDAYDDGPPTSVLDEPEFGEDSPTTILSEEESSRLKGVTDDD